MRRFFWKIIMHLLPRHGRWRNMVSSRIVKRASNLWMFTPTIITHYKAKLTGPFSNVSLLCVGTSHVENAINPEVMQIPTWNLGIRSGDLYIAYWLTKNTFMEGENKIIALGYDFWLQGAQTETSPMVGFSVLCNLLATVPLRSMFAIKPFIKEARMAISTNTLLPEHGSGGYFYHNGNYDNESIDPAKSTPARAKAHLKTLTHQATEWIWLEKLQLLCEKRNARLVVFFPPSRADYRAFLPSKQILFGSFLNHFPEIPLLDCFDDPDFIFEDFGDADHLNPHGAAKLSHKLETFIKALEPIRL
ncbi:MAG: hypothetical protein RR268_06975 [Kiritimatiellia bacterium]